MNLTQTKAKVQSDAETSSSFGRERVQTVTASQSSSKFRLKGCRKMTKSYS